MKNLQVKLLADKNSSAKSELSQNTRCSHCFARWLGQGWGVSRHLNQRLFIKCFCGGSALPGSPGLLLPVTTAGVKDGIKYICRASSLWCRLFRKFHKSIVERL